MAAAAAATTAACAVATLAVAARAIVVEPDRDDQADGDYYAGEYADQLLPESMVADRTLGNASAMLNASGGDLGPTADCRSGQLFNLAMITMSVVGTIGNVASVAVMRTTQSLRVRSGTPALTVLIFFNTLGLFFNALSSIDDMNYTYNNNSIEAHVGPIGCKLLRYVPNVIQLMGHWLVVYITAQRFVATCMPNSQCAFFRDDNAKFVFTSIFLVVAATQLWRPFLDTQAPAVYVNGTNGTMELESLPYCTAEHLGVYIDMESFLFQLGLLFFLPSILILVMNAAVILNLYRDYHQSRSVRHFRQSFQTVGSISTSASTAMPTFGQPPQGSHAPLGPTQSRTANAFLEEMASPTSKRAAPLEKKLRKATIVLLAVTCTFWLYILPHLMLLLYVRLNELVYGRMAGYTAFLNVCRALNVTSFVAAIPGADYIIIQVIFDGMFRQELKLSIYRTLGRCWLHCQYKYIYERQKQLSFAESRGSAVFQQPSGGGDLSARPLAPLSTLHRQQVTGHEQVVMKKLLQTDGGDCYQNRAKRTALSTKDDTENYPLLLVYKSPAAAAAAKPTDADESSC